MTYKQKVILGVITFILGVAYLFGIILIFDEGLSFNEHPFWFVSALVIPFGLMLVGIILLAKNEHKIRNINKKPNIKVEFISSIILLIISIVGMLYFLFIDFDKYGIIVFIMLLVVSIILILKYYPKYKVIKKDKNNY